MFTAPAPAPPTVSASAISTSSPTPRSTGLQRGITFLRNLHLHSPAPADTDNATSPNTSNTTTSSSSPSSRPSHLRPRAATHTPPASPGFPASSSSQNLPLAARPALLTRRTTSDAHHTTDSPPASPPTQSSDMTRTRAETATPQLSVRNNTGPTPTNTPTPPAVDGQDNASDPTAANKHLPSIRFIPHQDPRAGRPSLQFPTITRTLPDESAVIRVGRYSERDTNPDIPANVPSAAAVGFKSKVVSRKHCELWCKDGSWFIKDVKSSSGTFLNHIRLSQPNVESKPFRIKDGDIIQLGIDFRGGEEMIFRCVKIRVECNRGWQQALNTFNKQTHQRLRNLAKAKPKDGDTASTHTSECAICLMSIAPCQSLFVAPCSHVWHYKCIRPILNGPTWPTFLCPNCRAVADLEEDIEDPGEFDDWTEEQNQPNGEPSAKAGEQSDRHVTPRASMAVVSPNNADGGIDLSDLQNVISHITIGEASTTANNTAQPAPQTPERRLTPPTSSVTQPVAINFPSGEFQGLSPLYPATRDGLTPDRAHDGPMTPRNDAGPFVLDGSAGRAGGRPRDPSPSSDSAGSAEAPSLPPVRFD